MTLDEATAVNDSGQIVCVGEDAKGDLVSFLLTPILGITGDTNCDRSVNIDDLLAVIQWWGPGASYGDLNGDRIVNILDLLIVIDNWNSP